MRFSGTWKVVRRVACSTLLLATLTSAAQAEVPLDGSFVAQKACPAVQSISRQTNPGSITLEPGTSYHLIAANKTPATHYWITVPGAQPDRRWVCATRHFTVALDREAYAGLLRAARRMNTTHQEAARSLLRAHLHLAVR